MMNMEILCKWLAGSRRALDGCATGLAATSAIYRYFLDLSPAGEIVHRLVARESGRTVAEWGFDPTVVLWHGKSNDDKLAVSLCQDFLEADEIAYCFRTEERHARVLEPGHVWASLPDALVRALDDLPDLLDEQVSQLPRLLPPCEAESVFLGESKRKSRVAGPKEKLICLFADTAEPLDPTAEALSRAQSHLLAASLASHFAISF